MTFKKEDIVTESKTGAEDFRAIVKAITRSVSIISSQGISLQAATDVKNSVRTFNAKYFNNLYKYHLEKFSKSFILARNREGFSYNNLSEYINDTHLPAERTQRDAHIKLLAWNSYKGSYLEALCLLQLLIKYGSKYEKDIALFGKNERIPVRIGRRSYYLWTQPQLKKTKSGAKVVPDILVTYEPKLVTYEPKLVPLKAKWVFEVKCQKEYKTENVRSEFGRAFDLSTPSYTVLSYYNLPSHVIDTARKLGIDIIILPLDLPSRASVIAESGKLEAMLISQLDSCINGESFRLALSSGLKDMTRASQVG